MDYGVGMQKKDPINQYPSVWGVITVVLLFISYIDILIQA